MLKVERLTKEYQTAAGPLRILENIDLELKPGETAAIMGPSGSGKSTLLYMLGALDQPTSGVVTLEINGALRQWRTLDGQRPFPSAIVLRTHVEGRFARGVRFFGSDAADPSVRPRLVVSFVPNVTFGRP